MYEGHLLYRRNRAEIYVQRLYRLFDIGCRPLPTIRFFHVEVLEKIRSANDALRTWGNELYKEKEDIESDYESEQKYLKGKIDDLEYDLNQKDKEIHSLEQDLAYAEKKLECVVS